ncbi:MAG: hypothetical protein WC979_06970 [Candidatus Pacearchaeota archaeon]|jgi:hypothetical protein
MSKEYSLITDSESDIVLSSRDGGNSPEVIAIFPKNQRGSAEFVCRSLNGKSSVFINALEDLLIYYKRVVIVINKCSVLISNAMPLTWATGGFDEHAQEWEIKAKNLLEEIAALDIGLKL